MVLTVAVRMGEERRRHSRRAVLRAALGGAAAAAGIAACDSPQQKPAAKPAPDPLNPFYRDTATLLGSYEATLTAQPGLSERLAPLRDAHRAHLQALAREIGPGLENSAAGEPAAASVAALLAAEQEAAAAAKAACLSAPSYRAALLGSIAAARASHVVVLS
jgi:hypothetical protein